MASRYIIGDRSTIPACSRIEVQSLTEVKHPSARLELGEDVAIEGCADHFVRSMIRNVIVLLRIIASSGTERRTR